MFCSHLMMIICYEKDAILMDFSSTWIIRMVQSGCLLQKSLQVLVHSQFKLTMRVFLKVVRLLLIVSNISLTWPPALFFFLSIHFSDLNLLVMFTTWQVLRWEMN